MKRKRYKDLVDKPITKEMRHKIDVLNERKVNMEEAYKMYTDIMGSSSSKFKGDRYA